MSFCFFEGSDQAGLLGPIVPLGKKTSLLLLQRKASLRTLEAYPGAPHVAGAPDRGPSQVAEALHGEAPQHPARRAAGA